MESGGVVSRGLAGRGWGDDGELLFYGYRASVFKKKIILKTGGCTQHECTYHHRAVCTVRNG